MSSVASASWPSQFRPILAKLEARGRDYFGPDFVALQPVRRLERPFSTILQIRVDGHDGADNAFVKILKPRAHTEVEIESMRQNVVKDFEMTNRVHQGLLKYPRLTAVRPIACFPEDLAMVTAQAVGETLSGLLTRAAGWPRQRVQDHLTSTLRQAGEWVRAVQAALPQDREVRPETVCAYFERRLNDLEANGRVRLTRAGRLAIERHRDRLLDRALVEQGPRPGFPAVWIHADFCPENVIVRDERMTVLDFTMAKAGTVYHDVSHLHLWIDCMTAKPWFRRSVMARLQAELLDAFEPGLTQDRPLFELMLLQHVLCHLVEINGSSRRPMGGLYAARLHARHRRWLSATAGLDAGSWVQ
jgi:hypothetical protein